MSWAWTSPTLARASRTRTRRSRGRPRTRVTGWSWDRVALAPASTCVTWAVRPSPGPQASRSSRMTSRPSTNGCDAPASSSRFRRRRWNGASGSVSSRIPTGTSSTSSSRFPPPNGRSRPLPRSPASVVGSDRLGPPTRLQAQCAIGAGGGLVEPSELREDEAFVHPRAPVPRIDLEGALVASECLVELPEAGECVSLVVPRDLVGGVHLDRRVEAAQCVDETTELRERVALVQPGDLVVGVDVERSVDGAQRLVVPAEEDERGSLAVPRHIRPRDARAGRDDRAIVVSERFFVVFAFHIPLRPDELPPKRRRRVSAENFRGRQGRGPRHRRTDARDPRKAQRVCGIGDGGDRLANDGNRARDGEEDPVPTADQVPSGPSERWNADQREPDRDIRVDRLPVQEHGAEAENGPCRQERSAEPGRPGTLASNILCGEVRAEADEECGDPSTDEGLVQHAREEQARGRGEDEPARGLCGDSVPSLGREAGTLS